MRASTAEKLGIKPLARLVAHATHSQEPQWFTTAPVGAIRKLFDGKPLVAGVKAGLAHVHKDPAIAQPMPPLTPWAHADAADLGASLDAARA